MESFLKSSSTRKNFTRHPILKWRNQHIPMVTMVTRYEEHNKSKHFNAVLWSIYEWFTQMLV